MYTSDQTIAEIVSDDYRTAAVFKKHQMDFCCGGKKPVKDVCENNGLNEETLMTELNEAVQNKPSHESINFSSWSPELLITFIEQQHHTYVKEALPRINAYLQKVAYRHGETQHELIEIFRLFNLLSQELTDHTLDEEIRVFPAIKSLSKNEPTDEKDIPSLILELVDEHSKAGEIMTTIRSLSDNFTPPDWACNTYTVAFAELEAFEKDLHHHIHLENNILFPKAALLLDNNLN